MDTSALIEAAKAGDVNSLEGLLSDDAELEKTDAYGWTALNWAAGKGHTAVVRKLLNAGANPGNSGKDRRTAYAIALAAAHVETAALLEQATRQAGIAAETETHRYCKAYPLPAFEQFPGWPNRTIGKHEADIGYLHWDFSVTSTPQQDEKLLYRDNGPAWQAFCRDTLGFSVPTCLERAAQFVRQKADMEKPHRHEQAYQ